MTSLSFVMPFYNRIAPFEQYVREGFWDGVPVQAVCDGADAAIVERLRAIANARPPIRVHDYTPNRGVARARAEGIRTAPAHLITFCDDDDFMPSAAAYVERAALAFDRHTDPLLVTAPFVHAFNEKLDHRLQYDRRAFHGRSGQDVLQWMVRTGELNLLLSGTTFRRRDLVDLPVNDFFEVSEDYVLIARHCARHPHRKVVVLQDDRYMRLMHPSSLVGQFTFPKLMMNLVSMCVGGYYLIRQRSMGLQDFQQMLRERGRVLQNSYGMGAGAGHAVADLLAGSGTSGGEPEARNAQEFLRAQSHRLPDEFLSLAGWVARAGGEGDPLSRRPAWTAINHEMIAL